jgi:hypothetical protein
MPSIITLQWPKSAACISGQRALAGNEAKCILARDVATSHAQERDELSFEIQGV